MSPFLCVLHTVWPFWQCSMVPGSEQPPQESVSVSPAHEAKTLGPHLCLATLFNLRTPAASACSVTKPTDGRRRSLICHACPPLPLPALRLPIPFPGCDGVCHLSHTGLPSASRSFLRCVTWPLSFAGSCFRCVTPWRTRRPVSTCGSWKGAAAPSGASSPFLSGEASCTTHDIFSSLDVLL